jgi:hypothetical protein
VTSFLSYDRGRTPRPGDLYHDPADGEVQLWLSRCWLLTLFPTGPLYLSQRDRHRTRGRVFSPRGEP